MRNCVPSSRGIRGRVHGRALRVVSDGWAALIYILGSQPDRKRERGLRGMYPTGTAYPLFPSIPPTLHRARER